MRKMPSLALLAGVLALFFDKSQSSVLVERGSKPVPCAQIQAPQLPGANIVSIKGEERRNVTVPASPPFLDEPISGLDICDVKVIITHPRFNDQVLVEVWMPLRQWNGRFQGTGGSGYTAGGYDVALAPAVAAGYSAAMTNAGISGSSLTPEDWALNSNGSVNTGLLADFASLSVHEMAIVGKDVTTQYYGKKPYAYWNGCSTGGRQGLMEAQMYPSDFDGILSVSPAMNWAKYVVAEQWPQVVMSQKQVFPQMCLFDAFTNASIQHCDELDGVKDGVIGDVQNCKFDPYQLVGLEVNCDGTKLKVTEAEADIVKKALEGPKNKMGERLWYGLNVGTRFNNLAGTIKGPNGTLIGHPFYISDNWIKYFLQRDPSFDTSTITHAKFDQLFAESYEEYNKIIGTDNPDLSAFRAAGGKMIMWHGLADSIIFPEGTVDYRRRVEDAVGDDKSVDDFYRLFLPPGVDHCGLFPAPGPVPTDPLDSLISWVEKGKAPDTLAAKIVDANGNPVTKNICRFPLVSRYDGHGDPKLSASYTCELSFGP